MKYAGSCSFSPAVSMLRFICLILPQLSPIDLFLRARTKTRRGAYPTGCSTKLAALCKIAEGNNLNVSGWNVRGAQYCCFSLVVFTLGK